LGKVERERGNYAQAVEWLTQSRDMYARLEYHLQEANLWWWLAHTCGLWGQVGAAERHYQEARTRYEALDRPATVANVLLTMGASARDRGDHAHAIGWLLESRDTFVRLNRPLDEAEIWWFLAGTYHGWGRFREAEQ